jgi:hypothetical protein
MSEEPIDVIAAGGAATLAAILRDAPQPKLRRVVLLDPDDRGDGTPFDPTLCPSGGHLLRLWDRLRLERLKTPTTTPRDGAAVRGRYENLDLLGRYGWDAVSRLAEIPAWDRLVAAGADREAALLSDEYTQIVVTGVDRRGRVERHADAAGGVTLVAGTTSDPFREALAVLDQTAA